MSYNDSFIVWIFFTFPVEIISIIHRNKLGVIQGLMILLRFRRTTNFVLDVTDWVTEEIRKSVEKFTSSKNCLIPISFKIKNNLS